MGTCYRPQRSTSEHRCFKYYELDGIQRFEAQLSNNLPTDPKQSKQIALQRIQQLDEQTMAAALSAQRARDIVTRAGQPHLYVSLSSASHMHNDIISLIDNWREPAQGGEFGTVTGLSLRQHARLAN